MSAIVSETTRKVVLVLGEGTQTITPIASGATDENIYNASLAIGNLLESQPKTVQLIETQLLEMGE